MEKDQFLFLVKNYTSLTTNDLHALLTVQNNFPYSQTVHNLTSRAASDVDAASKNDLLHLSAIYTTDRGVLKSIMTAPRVTREEGTTWGKHDRPLSKPDAFSPAFIEPFETGSASSNLIENLFADLENLKKSKLLYEESMEALESIDRTAPLGHATAERGFANSINEEALVEEITATKDEVHAVAPKQKEQIEIIENFIKTQPTLNKQKTDSETIPTDLSDKNQHFADNVISETLVEILINQGKKEKAIEVLKKLIWKFPQKKAYFAAQIEDLKK